MQRPAVDKVSELMAAHYVFGDVGEKIGELLRRRLGDGAYDVAAGEAELAEMVTTDLQKLNGDKHLRLLHHVEILPADHGSDDADMAGMTTWAESACHGISLIEQLTGNVGLLRIKPLLFPAVISGEVLAAAMTVLAATDALIIDLTECLGGEPGMVAMLLSYFFDEPVQLSGVYKRDGNRTDQQWSLPFVPGRRFGAGKPLYVLTSPKTFSGGEAVAYDLQALGRAVVVGERTRGGAHPRRAFRVSDHLEVTIPVAMAVNPVTGGNWEGTGVIPDIDVPAADAHAAAHRETLARLGRPLG